MQGPKGFPRDWCWGEGLTVGAAAWTLALSCLGHASSQLPTAHLLTTVMVLLFICRLLESEEPGRHVSRGICLDV